PEGSKPSLHTATVPIHPTATTQLQSAVSRRLPVAPAIVPVVTPKKKNDGARKAIIIGCAALAALAGGILLLKKSDSSKQEQALRSLIEKASDTSVTELPMNGGQLKGLLEMLLQPRPISEQQTIFRALRAARATDITDVDLKIAEFATTASLAPDTRSALFFDVVRRRGSNSGASLIAEFARTTNEDKSSEAALQALWTVAGDAEFTALLETIQLRKSPAIRASAKAAALEVLKRSSDKKNLLTELDKAIAQSGDEARAFLLELKLSVPKE
ncbi:MAG TPA: hypothetical protein VIM57_06815, partial [Luteolibacter sp.]